MNLLNYSYAPIRYVHDPTSGEALNVGVVLFAPETGFLSAITNKDRTNRLSATFSDFDSHVHRQILSGFESELWRLSQREYGAQPTFAGRPSNVGEVLGRIWPDLGTRYSYGETYFGTSKKSPSEALKHHYDRLVERQSPSSEKKKRRFDEDVWDPALAMLRKRGLSSHVVPNTVSVDSVKIRFDHTVQNRKISILQPLSFDLQEADTIVKKGMDWYGRASSLRQVPTVDRVLLLVGAPSGRAKLEAYKSAMQMLKRAPEGVDIFEESSLLRFADEVDQLISR